MKNGQTIQEQQRQTTRTSRATNTPQTTQEESSSWQVYVLLGIIILGVLMLAAKVSGIF